MLVAAQILDEPRYLEIATRAANSSGQISMTKRANCSIAIIAAAAAISRASPTITHSSFKVLLDLYETSFDVEWLKFAVELQETQDRFFFDEKNGGYFSTSGKDESVFLRMKDDNDSAEPAASSVAALNLLRLAQFRDDKQIAERARKTIDTFAATLSHFPSAMPQMLVALDSP